MVLPFFGRKPTDSQKAGVDARSEKGNKSGKSDTTSTMDFFTHMGDVGRALAAAAGKIQVQEVAADELAAIEEAAVLFANANDDGARSVLEVAVEASGGNVTEVVWRMLFDLYRLTSNRAGFDAQGEKYARLFEKSPPGWDDESGPAVAAPTRENAPAVNLSGNLTGAARAQFEQLVRIGAKMGKLRVDLSKLRGIDDSGCQLLNDTLASLRRDQSRLVLIGAQHAVDLLGPRLKLGEAVDRDYWILSLALMQHLNDQARFEDMAINYAVTFEESPPSWDPPDPQSLTDTAGTVPAPVPLLKSPPPEGFVLDGVMGGAQPEILRKLAVYASERETVKINARGLKRLEFVSAGALFNLVAQFQTQGKLTIIHQPNELVAALMRVMGIDQVAQIEYKKF